MNYAAHALVAAEVLEEPSNAEVFGSMAPDLVGMARSKINRNTDDADLAAGIQLHIDTDRIFDTHPDFIGLKSRYMGIHEEHVPRGTARLMANAGTEMLLDGFVLQKHAAREAYWRAIQGANQGEFPYWQAAKDPEVFRTFCEQHAHVGVPAWYGEPATVAERLYNRVKDRPRSAFDKSLLPQIIETFQQQQHDIGDVANAMVEDTIAALRAERDADMSVETGPLAVILPNIVFTSGRVPADIARFIGDIQAHDSSLPTTQQFAAGRYFARYGLDTLGVGLGNDDTLILPRGRSGEPVYPGGSIGSITHTDDWVLTAAARAEDYATVGVDLERAQRTFSRDIAPRITTPPEQERFADITNHPALLISSVKEAVYKAIHPYAQRRVGFHEVELFPIEAGFAVAVPQTEQLARELGHATVSCHFIQDAKWITSVAAT